MFDNDLVVQIGVFQRWRVRHTCSKRCPKLIFQHLTAALVCMSVDIHASIQFFFFFRFLSAD